MNDREKSKDELMRELAALRQFVSRGVSSGPAQEDKEDHSAYAVAQKKLVGKIAHEFNNILTAIAGNIALAKMYAKPGLEVFDILEQAEKASLRAKYLVQQLFPLSQSGLPVKKTIYIKGLITDAVSFAFSDSQMKREISIQNDLSAVMVDEGQLRQVIQALIFHVRQRHADDSRVRIDVDNVIVPPGTDLPVEEGKYVRISISHEGVVIPKEDLSNIFDPFFMHKNGDIGIGLAAVQTIIANHSGYIFADSAQGDETTFTVYLPASNEIPKPFEDQTKISMTYQSRGRVLVMDDEEIVRIVISRMLSQCGFESDLAVDGSEALALYEKAKKAGDPYTLVILDLIVPEGLGGKETIAELLKIDPSVRAMVSSGYSNDPIMANFRDYGFKTFLYKPYNMEQLYQALEEVTR